MHKHGVLLKHRQKCGVHIGIEEWKCPVLMFSVYGWWRAGTNACLLECRCSTASISVYVFDDELPWISCCWFEGKPINLEGTRTGASLPPLCLLLLLLALTTKWSNRLQQCCMSSSHIPFFWITFFLDF